MVFNSFSFLFAYLPIVLILFWVSRRYLGRQWADVCLIVASLVFYGWNYPKCLPVLLGSLIVNYAWGCFLYRDLTKKPKAARGKAVEKNAERTVARSVEKNGSVPDDFNRRRKCILGAGIVLNVAVLGFFKYARLLPVLQGMELDAPGISFFTFTQIAFLVETYRRNIVPMGMSEYGLYVSFFPKLMQGPTMLPEDFQAQRSDEKSTEQRSNRKLTEGEKKRTRAVFEDLALRSAQTGDEWWEKLLRNVILISLGLFKKVILADTLGQAVAAGFENVAALRSVDAWVVMLSYTLQLYFDFSGYCDIAMGVAAFFGYDLPLNFDSPYKAVNIMDFWKRWHKTLTDFLTKYVYIPLGGSRKGKVRTLINTFLMFFLSGLWHGANWTFIVWGLWHGFFIVAEDAVKKLFRIEKHGKGGRNPVMAVLKHLYTLLVVLIGFVIFRADNMEQAASMIRAMFSGISASAQTGLLLAQCLTPLTMFVLLLGLVGSTPILPMVCHKAEQQTGSARTCLRVINYAAVLVLLLVDILHLSAASYVPFIYFQF